MTSSEKAELLTQTEPVKRSFKVPHWLRHDWSPWSKFEMEFLDHSTYFPVSVEESRLYQSRKCNTCGKYQQERIYY